MPTQFDDLVPFSIFGTARPSQGAIGQTRNGQFVGPLRDTYCEPPLGEYCANSLFPWTDKHGNTWSDRGRYLPGYRTHPLDLVKVYTGKRAQQIPVSIIVDTRFGHSPEFMVFLRLCRDFRDRHSRHAWRTLVRSIRNTYPRSTDDKL